jgi:hypothetical protein
VHLAAIIIAALILMFHPAANAYIRETRRTRRSGIAHKSAERVGCCAGGQNLSW